MVNLLSFGQYNGEGEVASRYRPGVFWFFTGWKPSKVGNGPKYDRLMFDVTYNDWVGDRPTFKMQGPSMGMNVNWMFDFPIVQKSLVSVAFGPSYGFYHLRHDYPVTYNLNNGLTQLGVAEDVGLFGKRKFIGHQLSLPFEFRFRTKGWRHFKVHLGGKIGYQFATKDKWKYTHEGEDFVEKININPFVNRLVYSAHVRVGIRNWALFASYNFNRLFKNEDSPELNLMQVGLSISLF